MTSQSLAVESFARAERSAATTTRSWWPMLFTACLWMAGILFLYVRSEGAPPESGVMLLFGAALMALGSALAARARTAR
jgi:uncharacterized membrane protein